MNSEHDRRERNLPLVLSMTVSDNQMHGQENSEKNGTEEQKPVVAKRKKPEKQGYFHRGA